MENNNDGITTELINFIVTNVKLISGIEDTSQDNLLILYATMLCNNFLIKTNRRVFPDRAKYLMIDLTKDKFDVNNTSDPELNAIRSMSEEGRNVNFGASSILENKLNLIARKQLEDNENLVNKFKLLYRT